MSSGIIIPGPLCELIRVSFSSFNSSGVTAGVFLASLYKSTATCHNKPRIPPPIHQRDILFLDNADDLEYLQYESGMTGRRNGVQHHCHMGRERCGEDSSDMPAPLGWTSGSCHADSSLWYEPFLHSLPRMRREHISSLSWSPYPLAQCNQ